MRDRNNDNADIRDERASSSLEAEAEGPSEATAANLQHIVQDANIHPGDEDINLEMILDIPVTISMEVGSTKINIRNLLQLNQGSVIELDRMAGEPLDIKVNGTLIAHGEVVVVNEKFGIRLTDVISPVARVKNLKSSV